METVDEAPCDGVHLYYYVLCRLEFYWGDGDRSNRTSLGKFQKADDRNDETGLWLRAGLYHFCQSIIWADSVVCNYINSNIKAV